MELHDFYLDKTIIFSLISQEKIFEKYLFKPDLSKKYTNPFRVDNNPDCTFYYKNDRLYFVDNAWNKKHYDCFSVVCERYKCSFQQSLRIIYNEIDKEVDKPSNILGVVKKDKEYRLEVKTRDFLKKELDFWNIGGLTITQEQLNSGGWYAVTTILEADYIIDGCTDIYCFVEDGKLVQIYKPLVKRSSFSRRFINVPKIKYCGYNSLDFTAEYVIIGKANKCSFYMKQFGINVFNIINEGILLDNDVMEFLRSVYKGLLFTFFDNDYPGKRATIRYRQTYGTIPLLVPKDSGKDFSEYLDNQGFQSVIDEKEYLENKFIHGVI